MQAADLLARLAASTRATVRTGGDRGEGDVDARWDDGALVLSAEGTWAPGGRLVRWRSRSRWHVEGEALAVAWLRQDAPAAVTLDRQPAGAWVGRAPFVCAPDTYSATLRGEAGEIVVTWTVTGPRKAMVIETRYG